MGKIFEILLGVAAVIGIILLVTLRALLAFATLILGLAVVAVIVLSPFLFILGMLWIIWP